MTRLSWDQDLNRRFEFGVDRVVLYPENGVATPWNGVVNINENHINDGVSSYYFDGSKYIDLVSNSTSQITLTAFDAPEAFNEALGKVSAVPGFILTRQPKVKFGLSYRTNIGDGLGYKLHLVYNATVTASNITRSTIDKSGDVQTQSWTIDTTPLTYAGLNPSAHIIFDSTKMASGTVDFLEAILYGNDTQISRLPSFFELKNMFESWGPVKIEFDDSGYSALVSGVGDLITTQLDGILVLIQTSRLGLTSDPGIYRLES
jgi:hypothetical protein